MAALKGTGESLPASSTSDQSVIVACRICCTEMGIKASPLNNLVTTKYMNLALKLKNYKPSKTVLGFSSTLFKTRLIF